MESATHSLGTPLQISYNTDFDEIDNLLQNVVDPTKSHQYEYDLIQQSIISGNVSALSYLLKKTYVPKTYHPACNDYMHLACKLGQHIMVTMIVEARPDDFFRKGKACYPNPCFHKSDELDASVVNSLNIAGQLPLDIVVTAGKNIDCLQALLNNIPSDMRRKLCPAAFLCDLNHPSALQMLLKSTVSDADCKAAYRHALVKKRHECLEILFSAGYKDVCIGGMNPYHILYQYSSGYNRHISRHEGLTASTQVLLKHGLDISAHKPAGSYPLYSLLDLIMKDVNAYGDEYVSEAISGHELLSSLKLILKQGVRIDLDELYISLRRTEEDQLIAFGRDMYRSVFQVISVHASTTLTVNLAASEVILECTNILLACRGQHALQPSYLTGVLKLLGRSQRSKSIQKNLETVVYQYLWQGINTGHPIQQPYGVNCQYMTVYLLNQYIESLCTLDSTSQPITHTLNRNLVIKWLVNTMSYNALCTACRINLRVLANTAKPTHLFTASLEKFITSPPLLRLKTLAARVVWFSIERRRSSLQTLPLPNHMKSNFLDIIIKEI